MYKLDNGALVLSPSDLVGHAACAHRTVLDRQLADGLISKPQRDDPMLDLLVNRGVRHEDAVLAAFKIEGRSVAEIPDDGVSLEERARLTEEALRAGPDVIYQATFFDGRWRGHADCLLKRADRPSPSQPWSYDVADTKLGSKPKPAALLQMAMYGEQLERVIGLGPELLIVITGDGVWHTTPAADVASYARAQRDALEAALAAPPATTYPEPVAACDICRWQPDCERRRRDDDHLSLVAGMRRDHTRKLVDLGYPTVKKLANGPLDPPGELAPVVYERLRHQAELQVRARETGVHCHEVLPPEAGRGFALLPPPSPGDLFLDLEGHPFEKLEYLWGLSDVKGDFTARWAHDDAAEKAAFEAVVDWIIATLDLHPDMHVYHYASYEQSALKRLMGKHATREAEVDRLLRGGVLVDLYKVVQGGVRVSRESYSIKQLEVFYEFVRTADVGNGALSVVVYEEWLGSRDQALLDDIERYNEEDVASTLALRDWLETLRLEAEALAEVDRPDERDTEPNERVREENALVARLVAALDAAEARAPDDEQRSALHLLSGLVDYFRREAKPDWWAFYARQEMSGEDLVDETSSIGLTTGPIDVGAIKSSTVWRYEFPSQETKVGIGDPVVAAASTETIGEVVGIDAEAGWVDVRRASRRDPVVCDGLLPGPPFNDTQLRQALYRFVNGVLASGVDGSGDYRAARDLLRRGPPRVLPADAPVGETDSGRAIRLGASLDDGCLPVQGPPGSGKTWTGARLALDLIEQGKRVGVTAFSHRAIGNILRAIAEAAQERGVELRIVQKCNEDDDCDVPGVVPARSPHDVAELAEDADVVAGTAWLWAREELRDLVDTILIDEAGQMSLAYSLVVATAARNLVLLGDPQQLAQPAKGVHPDGAAVSGLEHVLAGRAVIPERLGVFLAATHRLAPAVCDFVSESFYDGQLKVAGGCQLQRVLGDDDLAGAGVRWLPVVHEGRRSSAVEEADVVAEVVRSVLGRPWVDRSGVERPIGVRDVLVLAPYNVQVGLIRARVPEGVRVGTVDKLQGQEAAVVVYSTTTSTADDIPRGLDFLYSPNRFNVAVSRARALCVLVGSPELLHARCRTIDQVRLVNTMCRYVEYASDAG